MNSSLQSQTSTIPSECALYNYVGEAPRHFSTPAYSVLVFNIIILVVTCPFTVVLNVLTMIAVKIKARLQSMSNIALACLAATDAMVGIFVQPLMICFFITTLQGETTIDVCRLRNLSKYTSNFFSFSSLAHLVLISADRYMAIKQSYSYDQIVTKTRVLIASAIAWIFTSAVLVLHFIDYNLFLSIQNSFIVVFMLLIIISTVVVYYETRRHEQQIAAQQVSVEARERFLKEKRALKLTTTIVVMVFLNYLPIISFRRMTNVLKDRFSIDTVYAVHFSATSLVLVNSFLNPLIYSVRLRQFRVALIELLLKKNRLEAAEFEKNMFGPRNAAPNDETNQGGETVNARIDIDTNQGGEIEEQNVTQVNARIDIDRNQGGEREEENVNQVKVDTDTETNQGGERGARNQPSER